MESKDSPNQTVSVRSSAQGTETPEITLTPAPSAGSSSSEKKPQRQTASANPVSPDDLLAERGPSDRSWIPLASAFAIGLVAGLIVGVFVGRD